MSRILGDAVPWVGTHPLFGPTSVALGENPLVAVVCPNSTHPEAHHRARSLYERIGCRVVEMDPDSHDRLMAKTHALAFFVAKGMLDAGVPGAPPVTGGPYRFLRHPNYLAVVAEVACMPLAGGCLVTAAVFSAANAVLLGTRIAAEERALGIAHARA